MWTFQSRWDMRKDAALAMLMLSIPGFGVLLLTNCDKGRIEEPTVGQIQQIESPLQNTAEGIAKAKAFDLERRRLIARPF